MKKIFILTALLFLSVITYTACAEEYSVDTPHVFINQVLGGNGGYMSHNFIELYNPTDNNINLTGWALHYRSSKSGSASDEWIKTDLSGNIPSHYSYLILCGKDTNYPNTKKITASSEREINNYDILMTGEMLLHNKGLAIILTSNNNAIQPDAEIFANGVPKISGYVDMLAAQGDDGEANQIPPAYESNYSAIHAKSVSLRRIKFRDTDNNADDIEKINYQQDISKYIPHSVSYGAWGDEYQTVMNDIEAVRKNIPKFYETYCTEDSAANLAKAITALDEALNDDVKNIDTLSALKDNMTAAAEALEFRHDAKIAQVYIATDNGDGESYGTSLTKAIGYVSAQIVCVSSDGSEMARDMGAQVKVRGNATAFGEKKPYNMKFSSKVDMFGFGKAKKWVLLADYYDATLMRNRTALTLSKMIELDPTMDNERVEVWVDGEYRGLYLLTEKIEEDKNRVNIDSKNGDFLIEMDWVSRTEAGNIYFTTAQGQYYRLREPEDADKVQTIKTKINEIDNIVKNESWEKVKESFDINSFILYYILNEYMKSIDFHQLSVYFYYHDGKFYAGPAWDYDNSSGNAFRSYQGVAIHSTEGLYAAVCHYYEYLFKFPEFQLEVFKKYRELCKSSLFEAFYSNGGLIDQETSYYSEAIARNNASWNVRNYASRVNTLKAWLSNRDKWLQNYYLNRIYIEDGERYYYANGEKYTGGFFTFENEYYHAGTDGKLSTGTFTSNGYTYHTDDTGKLLLRSLDITLTGSNALSLDTGASSGLPLNVTLTGNYGHELTAQLTSSQYALTWSADTGNSGLTFSDGRLTAGTSTKPGTYSLTVTATATAQGMSVSASSVITVNITYNPAPSDLAINAYSGYRFSHKLELGYSVTASSWKLESGRLPKGLAFNASTGVISGTAASAGSYNLKFIAQTYAGEAEVNVALTVNAKPTAPKISTSSLAAGTVSAAYSAKLKVSGTEPITFKANSLPEGLTLSPDSGIISGTPLKAGKYNINITAANILTSLDGTRATKTIKLEIKPQIPVISADELEAATVGERYNSVQLTTSSGTEPITWTASGLPKGMTISSKGVISGTPQGSNKTYKITITAANSGGKDTRKVPLTVKMKPVLTTKTLTAGTDGKKYSAKLAAKGNMLITWDVSGLPAGLTFTQKNDGTATITGSPTETGSHNVIFTMSNDAGVVSKSLSLNVNGVAPKINAVLGKGNAGTKYTGSNMTFTGTKPMTISYSISNKDKKTFSVDSLEELGLEFRTNSSDGTAEITGTPEKSIKSLSVTITASNNFGSKTKKLTLTIAGTKPAFTSPSEKTVTIYQQKGTKIEDIMFKVSGTQNMMFTMTSAAGFTLKSDGNTATLSGTAPNREGKTNITITAANSEGKATKKIIIQMVNAAAQTKALPENITYNEAIDDETMTTPEPENDAADSMTPDEPSISFGAERNAAMLGELGDGWVIAAILPEVTVTESGLYDLNVTLSDDIETGAELRWLACPQNAESSEDDTIAEFYDLDGEEILTVPEGREIVISVWFNEGVTYAPVVAVKSEK